MPLVMADKRTHKHILLWKYIIIVYNVAQYESVNIHAWLVQEQTKDFSISFPTLVSCRDSTSNKKLQTNSNILQSYR